MNKIDENKQVNPILNLLKVAVLGGAVSASTTPIFYVSNMVAINSKPKISNCFRGLGVNAFNDIPAVTISFMVQDIMKKCFRIDEKSASQRLLASSVAGAFAGLAIAPGDMIVLNYQEKKTHSMYKIAKEAYRIGGIKRIFYGATPLAIRESIYTSSYSVLCDLMADFINPFIPDEETRIGVGGFLAGAIGGAVTTPAKILTAQKQRQVLSTKKTTSYLREFKKLNFKFLAKNAAVRAPAVGLASLLLTEGCRHLLHD